MIKWIRTRRFSMKNYIWMSVQDRIILVELESTVRKLHIREFRAQIQMMGKEVMLKGTASHERSVGSEGRRGRWGTPTMALNIHIQRYGLMGGTASSSSSSRAQSSNLPQLYFPAPACTCLVRSHVERRCSNLGPTQSRISPSLL